MTKELKIEEPEVKETKTRHMTQAEKIEYWKFQIKWGWLFLLLLALAGFATAAVVWLNNFPPDAQPIKPYLAAVASLVGVYNAARSWRLYVQSTKRLKQLAKPNIVE